MSTNYGTYQRPDGACVVLYGLDESPEYRHAASVPGPALDTERPEVSLLLAVLERAILDLGGRGSDGGYRPHQAAQFALDAFEWVADAEDCVWGFMWVCDHLLLDIGRTRQQMFVLATRLRAHRKGSWHA